LALVADMFRSGTYKIRSRIGNRENLAKARCFALAAALALPQVRAKQNGGLMPFLFIISELHPLVRV